MKWKKIEGYENYSVSDTGLVMNTNTGKLLSFATDKDGYFYTTLSKSGKRQKFKTHRLVAQAFIPNLGRLETVDHINGIKTDNRACNLQWLSNKENLNKYWKLHSKPVVCIESGVIYQSSYQAAAKLGLSPSHIREVCYKQRKSVKNLHFEFLGDKAV